MPTGSPILWMLENSRAFQLMRLWIDASGGDNLADQHAVRSVVKARVMYGVQCLLGLAHDMQSPV